MVGQGSVGRGGVVQLVLGQLVFGQLVLVQLVFGKLMFGQLVLVQLVFGQGPGEAVKSGGPKGVKARKPSLKPLKMLRAQGVQAALAVGPDRDDAGFVQDGQMA